MEGQFQLRLVIKSLHAKMAGILTLITLETAAKQNQTLTWRERSELGNFLEGAGALLVQQLDGLQAKRDSGSSVEGV